MLPHITSRTTFVTFLTALIAAASAVIYWWVPVQDFSVKLLSNPAFSGACALAGVALMIRFELVQVIVQALTGIQIGKTKHSIHIILCGRSGAGKTAFIQRVFQHASHVPPRTFALRKHVIKLTYQGTLFSIHLLDYQGEEANSLLAKIRQHHSERHPVHFIFFIVSFFPVPETKEGEPPADPEVPNTPEERRKVIKTMIAHHDDLLSSVVLNELFIHSRDLRKIYLLINQVDLLSSSGNRTKEQRAEDYFADIFKRIIDCAPEKHGKAGQKKERVPVERLLISAKDGVEFDGQTICGFKMIERIIQFFSSSERS